MINIFGGATDLQRNLSISFVVIMFISVPLMLCVKPCVFLCTNKKHDDEHIEHGADGGGAEVHQANVEEQLLLQVENNAKADKTGQW